MKIIEKKYSAEKCTEAGWLAYDYFFEEDLDDASILALKPLGNFVYLSQLKAPFFKIENQHYMIKGIKGKNYFRVAVHSEYVSELAFVEEYIENSK